MRICRSSMIHSDMPDYREPWRKYKERELAAIVPILGELGFELEAQQPHMGGERSLMQAVTTKGGRKVILVGVRKSDRRRVIIKATSDAAGKNELLHERLCRQILHRIRFAYQIFFSPEEILFIKRDGYVIAIQEFIEQKSAFVERPLKEQFSLALKAFKAQEGAHATTYGHARLVRASFGSINARGYLAAFGDFKKSILTGRPGDRRTEELLERAWRLLDKERETIEQYSGFLTHVDFVPHNIRIKGNDIYLLDHSSLRFGNKYEGWARFVNFMVLYNRPLADALVQYVRDNRTPEESLSLKLMRVYRLGELIWYYTDKLDKTSGDLHALTEKRVELWSRVLEAVLNDEPVPDEMVREYKRTRDALRSDEEKRRQVGLH
ncbi:MAG: hypothetical protein Q8Q36_00845 [bacterium]|nr:hypothetical protein [bacterium]